VYLEATRKLNGMDIQGWWVGKKVVSPTGIPHGDTHRLSFPIELRVFVAWWKDVSRCPSALQNWDAGP